MFVFPKAKPKIFEKIHKRHSHQKSYNQFITETSITELSHAMYNRQTVYINTE